MIRQSQLKKNRALRRRRRHIRSRNRLRGTATRPRFVVFRSLKNIEGQIVDDDLGRTLIGLSTLAPELRDFKTEGANPLVRHAFEAGRRLGERACELGIAEVVFDRGGYRYHGRVRAFADGARKGGLVF